MIEFSTEGFVARLFIRRAAKKNALTEAMWREIGARCGALAASVSARDASTPRVLLLQGEDGVFCAGADIEELQTLVRDPSATAANNRVVTDAQLALERLPLATIAVIDGPCFGGGCGLAAACDFRIASARSVFAVTPARLGLMYGIEDTRRLVALLGAHRTRRLLMRSERLDAATALQWGLIDALVEPDALAATAERWAAELSAQSPASLAGTKATLGLLSGNGAKTEAQVRADYDAAFRGADFAEGAAAFLERRPPKF